MLIAFPKIIGCSETIVDGNGFIIQAIFYGDYPFLMSENEAAGLHLSAFKDVLENFDFHYPKLINAIRECDYLSGVFKMAGFRRIGFLIPITIHKGVVIQSVIYDKKKD